MWSCARVGFMCYRKCTQISVVHITRIKLIAEQINADHNRRGGNAVPQAQV